MYVNSENFSNIKEGLEEWIANYIRLHDIPMRLTGLDYSASGCVLMDCEGYEGEDLRYRVGILEGKYEATHCKRKPHNIAEIKRNIMICLRRYMDEEVE